MTTSNADSLHNDPNRLAVMTEELRFAFAQTSREEVTAWAKATFHHIGPLIGRRVIRPVEQIKRLVQATVAEGADAMQAFNEYRLSEHTRQRLSDTAHYAKETVGTIQHRSRQFVLALQNSPTEAAVSLLATGLAALLAARSLDADRGLSDTARWYGASAPRSVLVNSILAGVAVEGSLIAMMTMADMIHHRLPQDHDPLWDRLHESSAPLCAALARGASLGIAYQLLIDGLLQPAAYYDVPVAASMAVHKTAFTVNGVAEAMDVTQKDFTPYQTADRTSSV